MTLPLRPTELQKELLATLRELNQQIAAVKKDIEKQIAVLPYSNSVTVYDMKTANGQYVMTDLLHAKAVCLAALVELNKDLGQ